MVKGNINSSSAQPLLLWSDIKAGDGNRDKNTAHSQNQQNWIL